MKKELELYIHIPFCVKKCAYCDFLSGPATVAEMDAYVDALLNEIEAAKIYQKEYVVTTVFLGGGTPSMLRKEQTMQIMEKLKEVFDFRADAEITIELNPGTADKEKLYAYRNAGINRLSIGLQSADDRELKILGRIHTFEKFRETYELAREAGFENINVDLISAIPGQTEESYERTIRTVLGLKPEHISAYSLIIEEGTPFYEMYGEKDDDAACADVLGGNSGDFDGRGTEALDAGQTNTERRLQLPDEDTERKMYQRTKELLEEHGYHRYEISNYAKPGKECRHNIGYWERKEYLGFGIGAASLMNETRFANISDRTLYIEALCAETGTEVLSAIRTEAEHLPVEEQMSETMMLGLRMIRGVSKKDFEEKFGKPMEEIYGEIIEKYTRYGMLREEDGRIFFTEEGISVSNPILADFM